MKHETDNPSIGIILCKDEKGKISKIERVQESITNSKRPPPEKNHGGKSCLVGEPTPLFETEEWKNRRRTDK